MGGLGVSLSPAYVPNASRKDKPGWLNGRLPSWGDGTEAVRSGL